MKPQSRRLWLAVFATAVVLSTLGEADARVIRRRRTPYCRPQPARPATPPPAPKPVVPKTLTASGSIMSLYAPSKSLMILDDNTKSSVNLVITPQTRFVRDGNDVPPTAFQTYEHVTVSYQDTDRTVKEVRLSPPGSRAQTPSAKAGKKR